MRSNTLCLSIFSFWLFLYSILQAVSISASDGEVYILFKDKKKKSRKLAMQMLREKYSNFEFNSYTLNKEKSSFLSAFKEGQTKESSFFFGPDVDHPLYTKYPQLAPNIMFRKGNPHFYEREFITLVQNAGFKLTRWKDLVNGEDKLGNVDRFTYLNPFFGKSASDCELKSKILSRGGDYHTYVIYNAIEHKINGRDWSIPMDLTLINMEKKYVGTSRTLKIACKLTDYIKSYIEENELKISREKTVRGISLL